MMVLLNSFITSLYEFVANPLVSFVTAVFIIPAAKKIKRPMVILIFSFVVLLIVFFLLMRKPMIQRWITAMSYPIWPVFLLVVLPAIHLYNTPYYKWYLAIPLFSIFLLVVSVVMEYQKVPTGERDFYWLLCKPSVFIAAFVSVFVLLRPFLSLRMLRRMVRASCLFLLMAGGFALRANYVEYKAMLERRSVKKDVMNISETSPSTAENGKLLHIPSAPCRFAPDGGYVQGCNMELFQRLMQINFEKVRTGNTSELGAMEAVLASLLSFVVFSFLTARWFCGWVCPLSTMGSLLDSLRRFTGIPPVRTKSAVNITAMGTGLTLSAVTLAMARAYPSLDAGGKFAGVKIPIFPFCKICPSQQICPMAGQGLAGYPPLPGTEWAFGFFRYGCLILLFFYTVAFLVARRLWCRLCPMGMISGLFNRGGSVVLRKLPQKCNNCGVCAEVCPMNIESVRDEMENNNVSCFDCVLCMKCVEKCPKDGCLSVEYEGKKITESRFTLK